VSKEASSHGDALKMNRYLAESIRACIGVVTDLRSASESLLA
jgi:hypothetical protein